MCNFTREIINSRRENNLVHYMLLGGQCFFLGASGFSDSLASGCHSPMSRPVCGQLVDTSAVIRDLGFVMDDHLSMASQVSNICRSAYYHLSRIAKIRHSLTTSVCKSLIHGLVTSRLDYGNAMLFGLADRLLHRLEMVQRSAARVVVQIRRRSAVNDNNTAAATLAPRQETH